MSSLVMPNDQGRDFVGRDLGRNGLQRLSADNKILKKNFQKLYQGQTIWIQIRTDILSVLIWVQTVFKGYQQMTKATTSKEIVKNKGSHV